MKPEIYDQKPVATKLSQAEYSKLKDYCDKKGVTPSKFLRELITENIGNPIPVNIAGRNVISYNKGRDNFSWKIMLDDGSRVDVFDDLSSVYLEDLKEKIDRAVDERNVYLKKKDEGSVPVPTKMLRKKG